MKSFRIPVLVCCLVLFFISFAWLSNVLISSEKKSAEEAWRARLDGIAAMLAADVDEKMAGVLNEEARKAYYGYVSPGVLAGGRIDSSQGEFRFQKPNFVKAYVLFDFEGNMQSPEGDAGGISSLSRGKDRIQSIGNKLNALVKYENLTRIKKYDPRLAVRMMEGEKKGEGDLENGGWARLHSPDKGFAFVMDGNELWALTQVSNGKFLYVQGIVFDWDKVKNFLLESKDGLLPGVSLTPSTSGVIGNGFSLSSIPASLTYERADDFHFSSETRGYLKWLLALIWSVALLASGGLVWLVIAMSRLEKKRADFVSTVTHELRTPLTSMLLHVEMLEDGIVPEEKKKMYYVTLNRECRRLDRLIENILSYSRLQRGKVQTRKDSLTASELFAPLAERVGARLRQAGFAFSYAMARQAGVQLLATDILSVEQIIDNLASNAIKYVDSSTPEVQMTVQMSQWELIVRFRDNGSGIPRKERSKVFEPFRRIHSGKPGVGLGLALSRGMARSLGGDLVLESGNLEGVCFKLTLPLGPAV